MWLYVPSLPPATSSPSALASADLNSASCSPCDIGERLAAASATWRGKPQPPQAWSRRWKQGGFIRLLSGPTCSPSMLDHGVASFISSLRETRARTTQLPESAPGPEENAFSPRRSAASPPGAGLILSSARTSRGTRTDSSTPSSRHWKGWATALRQEYSARPKPETPCDASDCSSWPSACVTDSNGARNATSGRRVDGNHHAGTTLNDAVRDWAAPQARDHFPAHTEEYIAAKKAEGHGMRNLNDEAAKWEAPSVAVTDGSRLTRGGDRSNELLLTGQAVEASKQWAAPAAQNHKGSSEGSIIRADGKSREDILSYQAEQFFRPPSSLQPSSPDRPIAGGSMCSTDSPNSNQPSAKRKLNPIFVEALMRWPTGLSGFARQETAWTRWWLLMPSFLSTLCCAREPEQGALL